jgi:ribosomal protein S27E
MTNIKVRCGECREEVLVLPPSIALTVCYDRDWARYEFDCPRCGEHNLKPADAHAVSLLLSGGVEARLFELPKEFTDGHPDCGPITSDDMIEFHEAVSHINDLPVDQWL